LKPENSSVTKDLWKIVIEDNENVFTGLELAKGIAKQLRNMLSENLDCNKKIIVDS